MSLHSPSKPIKSKSSNSSNKRGQPETREIGLPVIIASVVVLLIVIGGLAWHFFGPVAAPAAGKLTADQQWMQQKAKETGGDFSKLSPEDQRRMIAIDGPRAPFDLRQAGRTIKIGP